MTSVVLLLVPLSCIPQSDPIPQSSSEVAASFAASRTHSEPDPSSQADTKSSSLFRSFSLRTWRRPSDSNDMSLSYRFSRWSRRRASTSATDSTQQERQDFLPLIRVVSPFFVSTPRKSSSPKRSFGDALGVPTQDNHKRAKFTLGSESDVDLPTSTQSSDHPPPEITKLIRRDAAQESQGSGTVSRRRWTLAMAMTDEDITDEALVEELENMRTFQTWGGSSDDIGQLWDIGETGDNSPVYDSETSNLPYTPSLPSFPLQHRLSTPAPAANASWQTARRALLTCRELVRTERHYLHSLRTLFASETETPPPPLMLRYLAGLVTVSEGLLERMQENPSPWGVAAAFLGTEENLEMAFSEWCGVVGEWFDAECTPSRKLSKQRVMDRESSPLKRSASTWRKSMTTITNMDMSMSYPPPSFNGSFLSRKKTIVAARKPAIRDLAILPTQRVMRYVLLYRDLLAHTPSTSPSRALVERAAEAARRIAHKCDRAQGNSAFFIGTRPPTTAKKSSSPPVLESSALSTNSSWRLLSAISLSS